MSALELTRFRGCLILWEGGPHDAENKTPVFAGISRTDGGFGAFGTRAEAKLAVFSFIEGWCNPHRRHSSINYLSPVNYEQRLKTAA